MRQLSTLLLVHFESIQIQNTLHLSNQSEEGWALKGLSNIRSISCASSDSRPPKAQATLDLPKRKLHLISQSVNYNQLSKVFATPDLPKWKLLSIFRSASNTRLPKIGANPYREYSWVLCLVISSLNLWSNYFGTVCKNFELRCKDGQKKFKKSRLCGSKSMTFHVCHEGNDEVRFKSNCNSHYQRNIAKAHTSKRSYFSLYKDTYYFNWGSETYVNLTRSNLGNLNLENPWEEKIKTSLSCLFQIVEAPYFLVIYWQKNYQIIFDLFSSRNTSDRQISKVIFIDSKCFFYISIRTESNAKPFWPFYLD